MKKKPLARRQGKASTCTEAGDVGGLAQPRTAHSTKDWQNLSEAWRRDRVRKSILSLSTVFIDRLREEHRANRKLLAEALKPFSEWNGTPSTAPTWDQCDNLERAILSVANTLKEERHTDNLAIAVNRVDRRAAKIQLMDRKIGLGRILHSAAAKLRRQRPDEPRLAKICREKISGNKKANAFVELLNSVANGEIEREKAPWEDHVDMLRRSEAPDDQNWRAIAAELLIKWLCWLSDYELLIRPIRQFLVRAGFLEASVSSIEVSVREYDQRQAENARKEAVRMKATERKRRERKKKAKLSAPKA